MNYYFCVDIPWENTYITTYENLDELLKENLNYMNNNNDWFIIKGKEIYIENNEIDIKGVLKEWDMKI